MNQFIQQSTSHVASNGPGQHWPTRTTHWTIQPSLIKIYFVTKMYVRNQINYVLLACCVCLICIFYQNRTWIVCYGSFPNLNKLLWVIVTLHMTSWSVETDSTAGQIKTDLGTSSSPRLNNLSGPLVLWKGTLWLFGRWWDHLWDQHWTRALAPCYVGHENSKGWPVVLLVFHCFIFAHVCTSQVMVCCVLAL